MYHSNNLEVGSHSENGIDVLKSNNENKMVLYYAHWCGFCKQFLPKWEMMCETVAKKHPNLDVKLVKVDCEYVKGREEEKLGYNPNVMGYPTIRVHKKKTNMTEDYEGPREVDDIVAYLTKNFSDENENEKPKKKSSNNGSVKRKNSSKNKGKKKNSGKGKKKSSKKKKSKSQN
tara:strand:+ start:48 stop:569 length:522 start_codon:yes stop_codon:yes gene_type:complete